MTHLIAFTGPAGAGKSQAALIMHLDLGYERIKFAGPLKAMLTAFYRECGLLPHEIAERIEGALKERVDPLLSGKSPRYAMQTIGTEWGRDLMGPDLWVSAWKAGVKARLMADARVVTDDCRFQNEADAVRALGGKVVRITGRGGISGGHPSERGVEPDFEIRNGGDVRALKATLFDHFGEHA